MECKLSLTVFIGIMEWKQLLYLLILLLFFVLGIVSFNKNVSDLKIHILYLLQFTFTKVYVKKKKKHHTAIFFFFTKIVDFFILWSYLL